jgi:predicted small lipoprotein YifL
LYGAAALGIFVVNRNYRPASQGWALILLSVAALALGGCGRKGPLDLPPNAPPEAVAAAQANADHQPAAQPGLSDPSYGSSTPSPTPKGPKKPFPLDPLLNSN